MTPKKTIHFVCQAKGGVGKSFFTYLVFQKLKNQPTVRFVDLDSANQTTLKRLQKPVNKGKLQTEEEQVKTYPILDSKKKINREAFLSLLESFSLSTLGETFYVDMGATESIEFLHMLEHSYSCTELQEEFLLLGIELHFNVIIAGGDVYLACVKFADHLKQTVDGLFPITFWVNKGTFNEGLDKEYLVEIQGYASPALQVKEFGSTANEESDAQLLHLMKNVREIDATSLNLPTRIKFRKLLNEIHLTQHTSDTA